MALKTYPYDVADYLDSDEMIAAYLTETMKEDDSLAIATALAAVARARGGMDRLAAITGIPLDQLQSPLGGSDRPGLDIILKVIRAFGLTLSASPYKEEPAAA